jgi:hypothetical protein
VSADATAYPVIHPLDVERDAVCPECGKPFALGDRYSSRLLCMIGDIPCTEAVCLSCAAVSARVTGDIDGRGAADGAP